jgi:hypothetical protein
MKRALMIIGTHMGVFGGVWGPAIVAASTTPALHEPESRQGAVARRKEKKKCK